MGGALSISIACLGLFGLATYNIQRRTKELGIRKVLGASGLNLFLLLSSSFAKQVGIAFLIATPLAWYMMKEWLKVFEYKISLHPGIFLLSGLIALLIALATISYRTFKATRGNPVNSLRQE
jgi:putative ABC transport system permease protein